MRISAFGDVLRRNAITHDQDMFASPEVMVLRKQTFLSSRRALLLELVRTGQLDWTEDVVTSIYASLNSDVMHAFSVHAGSDRDLPLESEIVRAARADIVDAGAAPPFALAVRDRFLETGSPFESRFTRQITGKGDVVHFIDCATAIHTPDSIEAERRIMAATFPDCVELLGYSAGFELMELGFQDEAQTALAQVFATVEEAGATVLVTSSPEAMVALARFAPVLGLNHSLEIWHLSEWVVKCGLQLNPPSAMPPTAVNDAFNLVRNLERNTAIERIMSYLAGNSLRRMQYHGYRAIPSGPAAPYIFEHAIGEMASRILHDALATGAERIVTCSPWDFRNLNFAEGCNGLEIIDLARFMALSLEE